LKSPQLVRLQQQFLRSLHTEPSAWLLKEIEPALGFGTAQNALNTYLSRAVSRTVDPLRQIYKHVRWILGAQAFEALLSEFYAKAFGEPLSPIDLSSEFAAFIENDFGKQHCDLLLSSLLGDGQSASQLRTLITGVALLDWCLNWCEIAPKRESISVEELLRVLNHRSHLWARPRLNRGTRIFHGIVDIEHLLEVDQSQPRTATLRLHDQPKSYLIYFSSPGEVRTIALDKATQRILSCCDGTHTLASIFYEEILFGGSKDSAIHEIRQLIIDKIIVCFQYELTTS
jgi:hypothetical protein